MKHIVAVASFGFYFWILHCGFVVCHSLPLACMIGIDLKPARPCARRPALATLRRLERCLRHARRSPRELYHSPPGERLRASARCLARRRALFARAALPLPVLPMGRATA